MSLRNKQVFVLGFALFAMFFGAGNLIFPPLLGRISGGSYIFSTAGFWLTGVGLPLLGIIAVARRGGGLDRMAVPVSPLFAIILTTMTILILGPLFAVPRTCATTFELAVLPNLPFINSWVFSFLYFGAVLFFALNPSSAVDRIGAYLAPGLFITLTALITMGVARPISHIPDGRLENAFGTGFLEGYQTMDLIAATVFGMILLNAVREKWVPDGAGRMRIVVIAGLIAASCLAFIYGGLIYLGASTSSIPSDFTRVELLIFINNSVLGGLGKYGLAIAVGLACLTTAIALVVIHAKYISELTRSRLSYRWMCIITVAVSLVISNVGVENIIKFAVPLLVSLYPVIIVLVVLSFFDGSIRNRNIYRGAVIGAFAVGAIKACLVLWPDWKAMDDVYSMIPLSGLEMGWILPAIISGLIGAAVRPKGERVAFDEQQTCRIVQKLREAEVGEG